MLGISSEKSKAERSPIDKSETPNDIRSGLRNKKYSKRLSKYLLKKELREIKNDVLSTDLKFYTDVLGLSVGDIKVDVYNYLDILWLIDNEARRRGYSLRYNILQGAEPARLRKI